MCVREPGPEDDLNEAAGSVPTASTAKAALYSGRCCTQPLGVAKIRKIGLKLWMACTPYSYSPASGFLTDYGGTGNKNIKKQHVSSLNFWHSKDQSVNSCRRETQNNINIISLYRLLPSELCTLFTLHVEDRNRWQKNSHICRQQSLSMYGMDNAK